MKRMAQIAAATALTAAVSWSTVLAAPAITGGQLNGKDLELGAVETYVSGDCTMVPVRQVGEALGFTVTWDGENRAVSMDDGVLHTTVTIGTDLYWYASSTAIGMSAPTELGAAPEIRENQTYVPLSLFDMMYSEDGAAVEGETLTFNRDYELPLEITETRVNGTPINLISFRVYEQGEQKMVPLETVAGACSFQVEQQEDGGWKLDNGVIHTVVTPGVDSYWYASSTAIGMSAPTELGAAPRMIGGQLYVPASLFDLLCGEGTITFSGSVMEIQL